MAARTWRNAGEHKATEAGWRVACFNPVLPRSTPKWQGHGGQ